MIKLLNQQKYFINISLTYFEVPTIFFFILTNNYNGNLSKREMKHAYFSDQLFTLSLQHSAKIFINGNTNYRFPRDKQVAINYLALRVFRMSELGIFR